MAIITQGMFKVLLPMAVKWAEKKQKIIMKRGQELSADEMYDARLAGIQQPEQVRVLYVPQIPFPGLGILKLANEMLGLVTSYSTGLPLYHGIFIRQDCKGKRQFLLHELAHVKQYEELGGIAPFFRKYFGECIEYGYPNIPMEKQVKEIVRKICYGQFDPFVNFSAAVK